VQLMEILKKRSVAECKFFKRAEDISRVDEVKVKLVGIPMVVGCKWKMMPRSRFNQGLDLITTDRESKKLFDG
ncbi:hypothetical protein A2U01_0018735, partial [Trifolium medium]|nr:hypothetical protein [Trifolium medium]